MNIELSFRQTPDGALFLEAGGRARRVVTVSRAARTLRRTRRQVYRYLATGLLEPAGKVLGEWLLDAVEVERAAASPPAVQPLPRKLGFLFPEYDVSRLNAGRDKTLVISRVLENGGPAEIQWAFKRYSRRELAGFIEDDGARLLGPRSLRLWSLVLGARPKPLPAWRNSGVWRK